MSQRRDELRQQHLSHVCDALQEYILSGGAVSLDVRHGAQPQDNEVVLRIGDWDHFSRIIEQAPAPLRGGRRSG